MEAELIRTTPAQCIQAFDLILRMQFVDALGPASRLCVAPYWVPETVPRVRIPYAPPYSLKCREIFLDFSGNCEKWAHFPYSRPKIGSEKVHC